MKGKQFHFHFFFFSSLHVEHPQTWMAKRSSLPLLLLCWSNSSVPWHPRAWYDCRAEVLLRVLEHQNNVHLSVFRSISALKMLHAMWNPSSGQSGESWMESNTPLDGRLSQASIDDKTKFWRKERPTSAGPLFYIWFLNSRPGLHGPEPTCTGSLGRLIPTPTK